MRDPSSLQTPRGSRRRPTAFCRSPALFTAGLVGVVLWSLPLAALGAATRNIGDPPSVGSPYRDVLDAAEEYRGCLKRNNLAAMMLAPTFREAASVNGPVSPMALSRGDYTKRLWGYGESATSNSYRTGAWNPGNGMWQLDDAGLGAAWMAASRISTYVAARVAAKKMSRDYCEARRGGETKCESYRCMARLRPMVRVLPYSTGVRLVRTDLCRLVQLDHRSTREPKQA